MEDSYAERFGALGGVVFAVLDVAIAVLGGEPPATNAGRSEIAGYYADKGPAIEAGLWLFGLAVMAGALSLASSSAAGFLGSAVLSATGSSSASSAIGFVGFVMWCVWILGISSRMWTDQRPRSTALVS